MIQSLLTILARLPGHTTLRRLGLALALTALHGCVGPAVDIRTAAQAPPGERVFATRIEFVDSYYRAIPAEITRQPTPPGYEAFHKVLWLHFHAVAGRLAGRPRPGFFQQIVKSRDAVGAWLEPGTQEHFALSLSRLERMVAGYASPYVAQPEDHDFTVVPSDTRFVRLTLSASSGPFSSVNVHEAGFIDTSTREQYVLVYVDRPCRISGDIRPRDGLYSHDLVFDAAGLHWLHIARTGPHTATVRVADPTGPVSVYVLYDRIAPQP